MGHGIAQAFAAAGLAVRCHDEHAAARDSAVERIRGNLERMSAAGLIDAPSLPSVLARVTIYPELADAVARAQFVTEAVSEDLALKQNLFARLEALVQPETILASNSSSYPISKVAHKMQRPERAVLTHWFNPPHIVPVVEVVPGEKTAPQTVQAAYDLLERIGKLPVRLNMEVPGFLVNRVQVAMFREIFDLLDRGVADAAQIDRALRGSMGMRLAALGPLEIIDFAGLDITGRVFQNLIGDLRSDTDLPETVEHLISAGRFGVKTGKGFFDYPPEVLRQRQDRRDQLYLALVKLLHETAPSRPPGAIAAAAASAPHKPGQ